jgi:hypothetical protein
MQKDTLPQAADPRAAGSPKNEGLRAAADCDN